MRKSYKSNLFSRSIVGRIYFIISKTVRILFRIIFGNRKNNLILLPRQRCCFKINSRSITTLSEFIKKIFFDSGYAYIFYSIQFFFSLTDSKIELRFNQFFRLLSKKLSRKFFTPFSPISFIRSLIY